MVIDSQMHVRFALLPACVKGNSSLLPNKDLVCVIQHLLHKATHATSQRYIRRNLVALKGEEEEAEPRAIQSPQKGSVPSAILLLIFSSLQIPGFALYFSLPMMWKLVETPLSKTPEGEEGEGRGEIGSIQNGRRPGQQNHSWVK